MTMKAASETQTTVWCREEHGESPADLGPCGDGD